MDQTCNSLKLRVTISDTTRQPDATRHENKRVWIEVFDPPTRNLTGRVQVNPPGLRVDPPTRLLFLIFFIYQQLVFNFKFWK